MTKPITRKMAVDCLLDRINSVFHGLTCAICGEYLLSGQDIQFDHIHADVHGGAHEYQNLRPVHAECHKTKTKADIQANAKVKRILADKPSKRPMKSSGRKIPSRPFQKRKAA
jgi:5-methylcytosine-specific restriction endonuclease McrA